MKWHVYSPSRKMYWRRPEPKDNSNTMGSAIYKDARLFDSEEEAMIAVNRFFDSPHVVVVEEEIEAMLRMVE